MQKQRTEHTQKLQVIQTKMAMFFQKKQKVRMYHGNSNSTRTKSIDRQNTVDVSSLTAVLEINKHDRYVVIEPSITMDALVAVVLPYGLMPAVVSEFPGITVGGAIQGGAGESSSYAWGCFHEMALEYEVVLGSGEVVAANKHQYQDLYYGIPCSYGTLGVLTSVKLALVEAPNFVELKYLPVSNIEQAITRMDAVAHDNPLFIDAIMFNQRSGVVIVGSMSKDDSLPITQFRRAQDEWFYLHA
jgi:delta24-sterol reductase